MKIESIRTIGGPNVFHHKPVLVMTLQLEDLTEVASNEIEGFRDRLLRLLPGLKLHRCSPGYEGGFVERLERGTYFAHIVEHIALELSTPCGIEVHYGKSVYGGAPGRYQVAIRYKSEEGMKFLLKTAVEIAQVCARGNGQYPVAEKIEEAKRIIEEFELGPSTKSIVMAAERRNIPWVRLNEMNLIQFGYGKGRKLIQATTTSSTSDIAVDIAQDKDLTKKLLEAASLRVPKGTVVKSEEEAIAFFEELQSPVALKPLDGHQGQGVSLRLTSQEQVREAYHHASEFCPQVIVEEFFEGRDYRVLVVGGRVVAASERRPAQVVGDGAHNISQLVALENQNPKRGEGHEKPMTKIRIDAIALDCLTKQGLRLEDIPPKGKVVLLRETGNLSTGGSARDVTDEVHPEVRALCERAARLVGLDICGVDLVAPDISRPLTEQDAAIVEVNAGPGVRMHLYPSEGTSRDVGEAIVDTLYPPGQLARIPIVSITGTNGKTTVTRMISHIMEKTGQTIGMTTSDGIYINGIEVARGDTTGPVSARSVLSDPAVEVAVLETARGGIVRRGLGYDWSDVGVLTNIQPDHFGQDGIESLDDIVRIKSLVLERVREGGTLVLNADDESSRVLYQKYLDDSIQRKITLFSRKKDDLLLRRHMSGGGIAFYIDRGWLCECVDDEVMRLIPVADIPITFMGTAPFQVANALAAAAAARAMGAEVNAVVSGLRTFVPAVHNSGRANVYRVDSGFVMVDYGHNPDAIRAIAQMTANWHKHHVTGVLTVPGDRSDEMVRQAAVAAAQGFDKVIIREDIDLRGRRSGEVAALLCATIAKENPDLPCQTLLDEREAMSRAIEDLGENEIAVLFYDDIDIVQEILRKYGAQPVLDLSELQIETETELLEVG